jgi:syntaxin 6
MHAEWKRLLSSGDVARNERFRRLHEEIQGELQGTCEDLEGIAIAVQAVERNRGKFPVDEAELSRRRDFLRTSRASVKDITDNVQSQEVAAKLASDCHEAKATSSRVSDQQPSEAARQANEEFLDRQQQEQQMLYSQQEDFLAEIGRSAGRMKEAAVTMNKEIKLHNVLLGELEEDVDAEAEKLNFVMKRIGKLLQTNDHSQLCVIIGLVVLLFVLMFLIINS